MCVCVGGGGGDSHHGSGGLAVIRVHSLVSGHDIEGVGGLGFAVQWRCGLDGAGDRVHHELKVRIPNQAVANLAIGTCNSIARVPMNSNYTATDLPRFKNKQLILCT